MSKAADCKDCPIRKSFIPGTAREKRLHHTYYKAEYDRMLDRLSTKAGKQAMRKRSSTVEPVLGSLIEYYGLGKISVKRREGAAKVMYMAAIAYNLKKYLRYTTSKRVVNVVALSPANNFSFTLIRLLQQPHYLYNQWSIPENTLH